jgi:hypothetical protein
MVRYQGNFVMIVETRNCASALASRDAMDHNLYVEYEI